MAYQDIIVERRGRVGIVTFNRPKALNALCDSLVRELGLALDEFEGDADIGTILVTGGEKAFAAGADIKEMKDRSFVDVYRTDFITRGWERIAQCRKPVIAALGDALPTARDEVRPVDVDETAILHLLDIGAGREGLLAARDEDRADIGVPFEFIKRQAELANQ